MKRLNSAASAAFSASTNAASSLINPSREYKSSKAMPKPNATLNARPLVIRLSFDLEIAHRIDQVVLDVFHQLLDAFLDRLRFRIDDKIGIFRLLVRRADAGKFADLAFSRF